MEIYDFHPSLSKSNEVYFGRNAPFSMHLVQHVGIIREFVLKNYNNLAKNKENYKTLRRYLDLFGQTIAKDLNAEAVYFIFDIDTLEPNAAALNMFYRGNILSEVKKSKSDKELMINLDKIADMEDILITETGYKYRNPKGKILCIVINRPIFKELETEQIAGILAHEIGHCFQLGIFGIYRDVADMIFSTKVEQLKEDVHIKVTDYYPEPLKSLLKFSLLHRLITTFISYLWFPNLLTTGIMSWFGAYLVKSKFKTFFEKPTFKMAEKIEQFDKGHIETNIAIKGQDEGSKAVKDAITQMGGTENTRNLEIEKIKKEEEKNFNKKDIEKRNKSEEFTGFKKTLIDFFQTTMIDVFLTQRQIITLLSLSNYTLNTYNKVTYLKKYEFFADIFSTSYGFGPDLYNSLQKLDKKVSNILDKDFDNKGLNSIPLFRALYKINLYNETRFLQLHDDHGTLDQRAQNMYTALVQELKTNPDLSIQQKKEILADIESIKLSDEIYYQENKISGFWFGYYNKLIDRRLNGKTNADTIEQVLEPIEQVCKESIQKNKGKLIA